MADATKISIRFLHALEQDRVDILPGGIFPRAFVRQYARYLGLDPDRVVAEFVYAQGGETVPARRRAPDGGDRGVPRGLILLAVAVGLLALVGWRMRSQAARAPTPAAPSISAPPATTFAHDRVYPPPSGPREDAARVVPGALVVSLSARRSSWVEARVDGTTVLNRVLKDGETQRLEARQEVVLSLGNAGGVAVMLNDRPLAPLGRDGEVKRNVAINAQTAAALMAGGVPVPAPSPPAPGVVSPRPAARPTPAAPAASPSSGVLLIPPGPGLGSPRLTPPSGPASPSPQP